MSSHSRIASRRFDARPGRSRLARRALMTNGSCTSLLNSHQTLVIVKLG
jgi:hypothetical protein